MELLQLGEVEGVCVDVPLRVADMDGETVLLPVPLGLVLGLAPALRVEGAEGDWEALRLLLGLGVAEAVPLPVALPVEEPVPLPEALRVLLLLLEALPVPLLEALLLGEAPRVSEAVALPLTVLEALRVLEGVTAALPVPVPLLLPV